MNNKNFTVCGIVEIDGKVLLVRHTYGSAKDRILLPGGFAQEGELPTAATERELLEETGVTARVKTLMSMQFKPEQWCAVFVMEHISGEPRSDGYENSEVLLLDPKEAIERPDITNMSRELLKAYCGDLRALEKSGYVPASSAPDDYALFY